MIGNLFKDIAEELEVYIQDKINKDASVKVERPKEKESMPDNTVMLSMLNIEEELTLRDLNIHHRQLSKQKLIKQQRPVYINIQMLCIVNFSNDAAQELNALHWVMEFFQSHRTFTQPGRENKNDKDVDNKFDLIIELNTLPLRELHYLWGNLGIKQLPAVLYRIKMFTIQGDIENIEVSSVKDIFVKLGSIGDSEPDDSYNFKISEQKEAEQKEVEQKKAEQKKAEQKKAEQKKAEQKKAEQKDDGKKDDGKKDDQKGK